MEKGLSILIPVYNKDVVNLVLCLNKQSKELKIASEIILLDDASQPSYKLQYDSLSSHFGIKILYNSNNKGRQLSRKKLAEVASFNWLLFLDCDCIIKHDTFLSVYADVMEENKSDVVCGGRVYAPGRPGVCTHVLRWKYGTQRETMEAIGRGERSIRFYSNNFLIKKKIFTSLPLLPEIQNYGHEDTYWGIILQEQGIEIAVVNNPVMSNDIETTDEFLQKITEALLNLKVLAGQIQPETLKKHVKIFRIYKRLQKAKCLFIIESIVPAFKQPVLRNLRSCNPSLFLLDLYRLYCFVVIMKKKY